MTIEELQQTFASQKPFKELIKSTPEVHNIELSGVVGSALAVIASLYVAKKGGVHIFVMEDRDAASYLCNDLYNFLDQGSLFLLPTAYKRSVQYQKEDASGIVQRTAVLNAVKNCSSDGYVVICTYPEAMVEKVVARESLVRNTLKIKVGDTLAIDFIEDMLHEYKFDKVDFVYEPGQFSIRGGIVDIFSFSDNKPYRVDLFGDEISSIRHFDISSQLSIEKLDLIEVVPNLKDMSIAQNRTSFAEFAGGATYWFADAEYTLKRFNDIRAKMLGTLDDPKQIGEIVTSRREFLADTEESIYILLKDNISERVADRKIEFRTSPQPQFNKKFELLAADINANRLNGYQSLILTENKMQVERLENIFHSIGEKGVEFGAIAITLHGGFVDHISRYCFYTDHQIFERFQRYKIHNELDKNNILTVSELNNLQVGDYVVHIDHGVGRFGGLTRTVENGKVHEAIKLVYRDNDVLLVNVHALHRISRYKDKDSEPPKIYKLGSGAWQKMKASAKSAVKDIARELIALYAKRKASQGFQYSPDSYLQHELEASFMYEDTPDQYKATQAVKQDMESSNPMDRLVCGDVGFGKTEVAIRAAFKAVSDSKQVAVLVPTTILALQHYRSFSKRLKEFPANIEYISRTKSAKDLKELYANLEAGKIDILIGTHKILNKDVKFKDLGLLIIDEEQKFGVAAKEKLRALKTEVDTLTLTATPIPRTLQFSLMGSRDLSIISTPPPNRQPVATESHLFDEDLIREAIELEIGRGGQVFFVHNRVETIEDIARVVRKQVPHAAVAVGHGQMNPNQLEKLMMDFIYGEYDVLVATTIIESGVDVPNANTIIINDAHRFGLSDLHQLRGRVGRSNRKAYCYLFTPPDEMLSSDSRRRLRAIEEFSDLGAGFNIAMQDLDIRGAGNMLGAQQSGFIADIGFETYQKILNEAMEELRDEEFSSETTQSLQNNQTGSLDAHSTAGVAGNLSESVASPETSAQTEPKQQLYISDCQIETDREAFIPDSYVSSASEKIRLYRELDNILDESLLETFAQNMTDRFGPIPPQTKELFDVVRLRKLCIKMGFEKAIVKNGIMILQFVHNQKSTYYKSPLFSRILKYTASGNTKFIFKQSNNKLSIVVRTIKDVEHAVSTVQELNAKVEQVELK